MACGVGIAVIHGDKANLAMRHTCLKKEKKGLGIGAFKPLVGLDCSAEHCLEKKSLGQIYSE